VGAPCGAVDWSREVGPCGRARHAALRTSSMSPCVDGGRLLASVDVWPGAGRTAGPRNLRGRASFRAWRRSGWPWEEPRITRSGSSVVEYEGADDQQPVEPSPVPGKGGCAQATKNAVALCATQHTAAGVGSRGRGRQSMAVGERCWRRLKARQIEHVAELAVHGHGGTCCRLFFVVYSSSYHVVKSSEPLFEPRSTVSLRVLRETFPQSTLVRTSKFCVVADCCSD